MLLISKFHNSIKGMRLILRHRPVLVAVLVLSQVLIFYLGRITSGNSTACSRNDAFSGQLTPDRPKTYLMALIMSAPGEFLLFSKMICFQEMLTNDKRFERRGSNLALSEKMK
jgi:hypothetical protein